MNPEKEIELTAEEETGDSDSETSPLKSTCNKTLDSTYDDILATLREVSSECTPEGGFSCDVLKYLRKWEAPYFPAFHSPGWLLKYILGPYTPELFEMFVSDVTAGITVALTLVPQVLGFAQLANLPPIVGLYTSVLPSCVYLFFGSSMALAVGPTAILSLLTGQLISDSGVEPGSDAAVDLAGQATFCCGIILLIMAVFNLGVFIQLISHPVMSGFTTGAVMTIGANQIKNAFGLFSKVPQLGQTIDGVDYHYNYQIYKWFTEHWYDEDSSGRSYHNPIATRICFGLFIPLMILNLIKIHWKVSKETKKMGWYRLMVFLINTLPLAAIIIGANIAWRLYKEANIIYDPVKGSYGQWDTSTQKVVTPTNLYEFYISKLKIVGEIPSGLNILRKPSFNYPWASFFLDVLPLTLINYMEAYSVARKIASERKELHLLSANQELYALGLANLVGCAATSYPVTGSYSRSALNNAAGARTPLSKFVCLCVVLLALGVLTPYFYFIPPAALSAIIWVSIYNLLSFSDLWEAWKHHKIDFFVMLITLVITFTFDTAVGLAAGVAASFLAHFYNTVFSPKATPEAVDSDPQLFTRAVSCEGIQVISFNGDLTFLTAPRLRDYFSTFFVIEPDVVVETETRNEHYFRQITKSLDWFYGKVKRSSDDPIPGIFTLDFTKVVFLDISGLQALVEIIEEGHTAGVRFYFINLRDDIKKMMIKFGVKPDIETKEDLTEIMFSYDI